MTTNNEDSNTKCNCNCNNICAFKGFYRKLKIWVGLFGIGYLIMNLIIIYWDKIQ